MEPKVEAKKSCEFIEISAKKKIVKSLKFVEINNVFLIIIHDNMVNLKQSTLTSVTQCKIMPECLSQWYTK